MSWWKILDASVLLMCASMYFGTGWSLVLFQFPSRAKLTVDNYYEQFVPPVMRATRFFTWMTMVMVGTAIVLITVERHSAYLVPPSILLAAVIAATVLTLKFIVPWNKRMEEGIKDNVELQQVLGKWMSLNWIRVLLWTVQWVAIATWFALHLR
jgi:hypothetical protein